MGYNQNIKESSYQLNYTSLAPIILFVYNRFWHTNQTVQSLRMNTLASNSILYIFSDASKCKEEIHKVEEVRGYIKKISGFREIIIVEREDNWGLARSIIDGVTSVINKFGKAIILEDDLVTSPHFLSYMNEALSFYENEERVMHISGYIPSLNLKDSPDSFFLKPTTCWGWATWKRAWNYFNKDVDQILRKFDREMIKDFNLSGNYDYFSHLIWNKKNKINTWAVYWYASVYLNQGFSLHPKESYVKNIGHDGSGTNCISSRLFEVQLTRFYKPLFNNNIFENEFARNALSEYFSRLKQPLMTRIKNKIFLFLKLICKKFANIFIAT